MRLFSRILEACLWISGSILLSAFLGHLALAEYHRAQGVKQFMAQQSTATASTISGSQAVSPDDPDRGSPLDIDVESADQSLWSAGRIRSFTSSLTEIPSDILAVFTIPRLDLEVPVYNGASDLHMDLGVARIGGTAMPDQPGNMGIAGHRDGFFRVLKDIEFGDELLVTTAEGVKTYRVQQLMIVDPSVVSVLDNTDEQTITLVTCYPFYFVGHAPERFIVRAELRD